MLVRPIQNFMKFVPAQPASVASRPPKVKPDIKPASGILHATKKNDDDGDDVQGVPPQTLGMIFSKLSTF